MEKTIILISALRPTLSLLNNMIMPNFIKSVFLLSLIVLSSFPLQAQDNSPLPDFSFTDIQGHKVSPKNLGKDFPVLVFYFDPDCDPCQKQAGWIKEAITKFKGVTMLWISWGEMDAISAFQANYFGGLNDNNRIVFCKDEDYNMDSWFGYSEVPAVYIYNKEWLRIASFKKETSVEVILRILGK